MLLDHFQEIVQSHEPNSNKTETEKYAKGSKHAFSLYKATLDLRESA